MSGSFYLADEFRGGSLQAAPTSYEDLDAAFKAIDRRRKDYQLFPPERRPVNFVILRLQAKFPFILPVDKVTVSQVNSTTTNL